MNDKDQKTILNRVFTVPADGKYQIMPYGEYDGRLTDGTKILQVLDRQAALNIAASLESEKAKAGKNWPGVLVDLEHRSLAPDGDTTAAAWLPSVESRPDGLFGALNMTDLGKPLVDGGQYRTLSPVFTLEQIGQAQDGRPRMRPVALHSIGLTNKPNLKGMIPLSMPDGCSVNSEAWFEDEKPETGNLKPETDLVNNKAGEAGNRKEKRMKEVLKALGLAEDADETAALTALNKLKETAGAITAKDAELQTAKNRVQELERKELDREADAFIAANADRIAKPEEVKKLYVANKETTVSLVAAMKPPVEGVKPIVLNRADGKTPDQGAPNKSVERDAAVRKLIAENKARTRSEAWALGATMNPELFKE